MWIRSVLTVGLVMLFAGQSRAEEAALQRTTATRSEMFGLGVATTRAFSRVTQRSQEEAPDWALGILTRSSSTVNVWGPFQRRVHGDTTVLAGDGWRMQVADAGRWIRYENLNATMAAEASRYVGGPRSFSDLEARARALFAGPIGDLIPLREGQSLEAWGLVRQRVGYGDMKGNRTEKVVASKITFTRVIDGIPVLGSGSKVEVTFNPEGDPIGFSVDWADYLQSAAGDQSSATADINTIRSRAQLVRQRRGIDPTHISEESPLQCGYYDAGYHADPGRDGLVSACVYRYKVAGGNSAEAGYIDVVPASQVVVPTAPWPESMMLGGAR